MHDFDFNNQQLYIRDSKGCKDRTTLFALLLHEEVRTHLDNVKRLRETDLTEGNGEIVLPPAFARKYPNAAKSLGWQFAFPSTTICKYPRSDKYVRHHLHETALRKVLKQAKTNAGINKLY